MNHQWHKILLTLAIGLVAANWGISAIGQEPQSAVPTDSSDAAVSLSAPLGDAHRIEYVGPDTYFLLDKQGQPQPILGMSYEEFVTAWKRLHQGESPDDKPRFAIEDLQAVGSVQEERIALDVEITIRAVSTAAHQVPLGMSDTILVEEPRIERLGAEAGVDESAKSFVSYDVKAGGYVAWIAAGPQRLRVSLKLLRPLVRDGSESSFTLNLPRSVVSRLALDVPKRVVTASASEGVVTIGSADAAGNTRLEVAGPRGDFRLSWSTASDERPELAGVISATGAIGISIDGHSVRSDAVLTVRSYGRGFEKIQIRLPPGAQLIDENEGGADDKTANYRVLVEKATPGPADISALATIQFDERQTGPVDIHLSTEQPLGLNGEEPSVQLAGFEVIGAVRQFGDVAVSVADDWQLRWENGPYVRQVERSELQESLRGMQPTAAFQYDRQPWSLRAEIVPRPMVVQVTPECVLRIGVDEAELRTRLKYQVPGARAFEFRVELNGWELTPDPVESNGLVDRDRAIVSREGVLVLPLSQASSRRAEVEFVLRRSLPVNATLLELPLPTPQADALAPGTIEVVSDTAIELLPDMSASRGLAAVPVGSDQPETNVDGQGERYLYRAFGADAIFVAQRAVRQREVATELRTQLSLDWQRAHVGQEFVYDVRYQPLTEITFALPAGWKLTDERVQVVPENSTDEPILAAVAIEPQAHGRPTKIGRAQLAQPRLGKFRVWAEFEFNRTDALEVAGSFLKLPQPEGVLLTTHRVEISTAADMSASIDPAAETTWRSVATDTPDVALALAGNGASGELPLIINPLSAVRSPSTRVEKVWLQTWQAGNVIQDRAAIQFRTGDAKAIVELPPSSTAADVEVLLDGDLADTSVEQEGRLAVSLGAMRQDADRDPSLHTLELRYRRPAPAGLITRLVATPPQLVGSSGLCDVLWHIVVPGDRHIVSTPDNLAAADSSQWMEIVLGRATTRSQPELEEWVGAAPQPGPTATQNAYLYSGLAPVSIELVTAPRWLIVLAASGVVLALASAWMYLPAARRRWIAIGVAILVAGLALAFPPQAVLAGQAALLGLMLAAVSLWLRRWNGVRTTPTMPTTSTGSTNMRIRSSLRTDSYYAPSASLSPRLLESHSTSSAPTAPLVVPEVDP